MPLRFGEPAPWFTAPTASNPEFVFDSAAGRYVLLLFAPKDQGRTITALKALAARQSLFDDARVSAFVVMADASMISGQRDLRGLRWFHDTDGIIAQRFQAETPHWLLLDPSLRVMAVQPLERADEMLDQVAALGPPGAYASVPLNAPVLIAPRIFEPDLCRKLTGLHEDNGGRFTGVMRDQGDHTVYVMDQLKRRRDVIVTEADLVQAIRERLERRLFPLIQRAFAFAPTRIERYLVSCYDEQDGGVFHPHRDNTTQATAHRAFACSINLNDDFEGGDLRFAEFGPATYRPPVGGAVVFSCSLMHEAMRITRGRRYAFLPFLYDEAGAQVLAAYEARTAPAAL